MKRSVISLAIGLALSASAFAGPITLQAGPTYIQFNNLEQVGAINTSGFSNLDLNGDGTNDLTAGLTENNWGVLNITTVQAGGVATQNQDVSGGPAYWANGLSGGQISGIFYGIQLTGTTTATGGWMDLYWNDTATITNTDLTGSFSPTNRTDWNQAGKFTSGTLLVRLQFQTGAIAGDSVTTLSSDVNPQNFTGSGQADAYASVVDINGDGKIDGLDGAWAFALDSDWFFVDPNGNGIAGESGETRDIRFSTFFNNLNSWDCPDGSCQGLRSNDPARAYVVPEPSMLGLLGLGLFGLGLGRRFKKTA